MKHTKIIFYVCLVAIILFSFAFAVRRPSVWAEQIERSASNIKEKEVKKTGDLSVPNSPSQISPTVEKEKALPKQITSFPRSALRHAQGGEQSRTVNYILITDVLDGFGGQKYDGGCRLSYFAGGQSSPIGAGSSTNYKLYAGFIYPTVVLCGDVNQSGSIELGDLVYLITYQYKNGPPPQIYQTGDVNCSGIVELGDVVYLITFLYKGGPAPVC
jgi:hypothetical protein